MPLFPKGLEGKPMGFYEGSNCRNFRAYLIYIFLRWECKVNNTM